MAFLGGQRISLSNSFRESELDANASSAHFGGCFDETRCFIVLQTSAFEHFKRLGCFACEHFERFAFERSWVTVPSWHGFALSE
jgi:hypothetical protein